MLIFADPIIDASNLWEHISIFLSGGAIGASGWAILGRAVSTFPTPNGKYGQWALGVLQFAVGQHIVAKNTFAGADSVVTAIPKVP